MSKGSAPAPPDPYASAAAQTQASEQVANYGQQLNDMNTVGPTGTTSYSTVAPAGATYNPATGTYTNAAGANVAPKTTQTTTLSAPEQALLTQGQTVQQGTLNAGTGYAADAAAAGVQSPSLAPLNYNVNTSNVPGIDPITGMEGLEQYGQSTALAGEEAAMQPEQSQQIEETQAQLINSGNPPGSPAYENAMATLNAQLGQQNTQAAGAAITAGTGLENTVYGEEANTNSQLFGQDVTSAGFTNSADAQALSDWAQQSGIPLSALSTILSSGGVTTPSAISPTAQGISAPDIMSAFQNEYAGELSSYNAGVSSTNSEVGDAASMAALAYMWSDERMKKDKEQVGHTRSGLPAYLFRYKGESDEAPKRLGVMAQDVEKVDPAAVHHDASGRKFVDYSRLQ